MNLRGESNEKNFSYSLIFLILLTLVSKPIMAYAIDLTEREINESKKHWTIEFNKDLDENILLQNYINILDKNHQAIESDIKFKSEKEKSHLVITPMKEYNIGETYSLYIDENVKSIGGDSLDKSIEMPFKYIPENYMEIVRFSDPNLDRAIREKIDKLTGDILFKDLQAITSLDISNLNIKSLEGVENLRSLRQLYSTQNNIEDIRPLAKLKSLETLSLGDNKIKDIKGITNLLNIDFLDLSGNDIEDLSGLSQLKSLRELHLAFNRIKDITELSNLENIRSLFLYGNMISDISPLANLYSLESLYLKYNYISDFTPLENIFSNLINTDIEMPGSTGEEYINISGILIGDSEEDIINKFGQPNRKDDSGKGYEWYIYNKDYGDYIQIGIAENEVVSVYSSRKELLPEYGVNLGMSVEEVENKLSSLKKRTTGFEGSENSLKYEEENNIIVAYFDVDFYSHDFSEKKLSGLLVEDISYISKKMKTTDSVIQGIEKQIFDLVNVARSQHSMNPYEYNEKIQLTAKGHSEDMAKFNYVGHDDSSGKDPFERLEDDGMPWYTYHKAGENVAGGSFLNAIDMHYVWLDSPLHKENILSYDLSELAVGISSSADTSGFYVIYGTQLFMSPKGYAYDFYIDQERKKDGIVYSYNIEKEKDIPLEIVDVHEVELIFLENIYNINMKVEGIPEMIDLWNKPYWAIIVSDDKFEYKFEGFTFPYGRVPYYEAHNEVLGNIYVKNIDDIDYGEFPISVGSAMMKFDKYNNTVRFEGINPNYFDAKDIKGIKIITKCFDGDDSFVYEETLK